MNSKKSLGEYHCHTAEVYKDIGILYMKMNLNEESYTNLEIAYKIYVQSRLIDCLYFAEVCFHLSTLCLA